MAFITQYNFNRIVVNIDNPMIKKGLKMENRDERLYPHQTIDWFSELEATRLFLCKLLIDQNTAHPLFDKMVREHWLHIYVPSDNYLYAVKPKAPSYHSEELCPGVNSNFCDFKLPVGFRETYGIRGVERFRQWLNTPDADVQTPFDVLKRDPERFKIKCEARWPGKEQKLNWNVHTEEKNNSGIRNTDTVKDVRQYIENLMTGYKDWLQSLNPLQRAAVTALKRHSWQKDLSFKGLDTEQLSELMKHFRQEFKNRIVTALLTYYYKTAEEAGKTDVDAAVLESIGFKRCKNTCCHA